MGSARISMLRPPRVVVAVLSAVLVGLFVVDVRWQPGGESTTRAIDDLVQLLAASAAALSAGLRARHELGRMRWSWRLLASGLACWAGGQAVWTYYEVIRSSATPFPSLADGGYLLLAMAGLLLRPSHAFAGRGRLRSGLDAALVLVSLFAISWATLLGQVYRGGATHCSPASSRWHIPPVTSHC